MEVSKYLNQYKNLNDYFAPDYEQENAVLTKFKNENPTLSDKQISEFKTILLNHFDIHDKYFVADLLYLYPSFSEELLNPLIDCAIAHEDPSFNRIFLRPCIISFGVDVVEELLNEKGNSDNSKLEGINRLRYWLHRPIFWE
jgi:hypothetical protein